jgi:DNA-binding PadR family transcriptional regulator
MSTTRLTPTSYIVLGLVEKLGSATPYDLKRAVGMGVGNFWSVPHTQLYAEPERLAKAGFLREERERDGRRRRIYSVTDAGRAALDAWRAEPTGELTEMRDPGLLKLFFDADPSSVAPVQAAAHRAKLAEYEAVMAAGRLPEGMQLALEAGIAHEREWVRFWETLVSPEDARPARAAPSRPVRAARGR